MSAKLVQLAQDLYTQHYSAIIRKARWHLRNHEGKADYDDLVEDALAQVWYEFRGLVLAGRAYDVEPKTKLLRFCMWACKKKRRFAHKLRNEYSVVDGSRGCVPIEFVMRRRPMERVPGEELFNVPEQMPGDRVHVTERGLGKLPPCKMAGIDTSAYDPDADFRPAPLAIGDK